MLAGPFDALQSTSTVIKRKDLSKRRSAEELKKQVAVKAESGKICTDRGESFPLTVCVHKTRHLNSWKKKPALRAISMEIHDQCERFMPALFPRQNADANAEGCAPAGAACPPTSHACLPLLLRCQVQ